MIKKILRILPDNFVKRCCSTFNQDGKNRWDGKATKIDFLIIIVQDGIIWKKVEETKSLRSF